MTSLVAIRCSDGVVVGADSSATFSAGGQLRTIEQQTNYKIRIVGGKVIVAGTGQVGLAQRFHAAVESAWATKQFSGVKSGIEFGKKLAAIGINDFRSTGLQQIGFSALAAFPADGSPHLCELDGASAFQPEMKLPDDLWYVSVGSGQPITDPFLALMSEVFWPDGAPNVRGGIFTALWALKHVCKVNPGGIGEPIHIAVLEKSGSEYSARLLLEEELAEHRSGVESAMKHLGDFRRTLEGEGAVSAIPKPAS